MFQSLSTNSRKKILANWSEEHDTCSEDPKQSMKWTNEDKQPFPYEHGRPLPQYVADKAIKYIDIIIAKEGYPFQLRYAMALPLWNRFCEEWCSTGDEQRSLRAI